MSRKTSILITCKICGKVFEAGPNRKCCSPRCATAAATAATVGKPPSNKIAEERECPMCGKKFETPPSKNQKFCSAECANRSRVGVPMMTRRRITISCAVCGKEFETVPSRLARGQGRFCSPECKNVFLRSIRGEDHPLAAERVTLVCQWCRSTYEVLPSKISRSCFCSRNCKGAYQAAHKPRTSLEQNMAAYLGELGVTYVEQFQVSHYACDFYLPDHNVIIECDGWHHNLKPQAEKDARRDEAIRRLGYRLVHVSGDHMDSGEFQTLIADALRNTP